MRLARISKSGRADSGCPPWVVGERAEGIQGASSAWCPDLESECHATATRMTLARPVARGLAVAAVAVDLLVHPSTDLVDDTYSSPG